MFTHLTPLQAKAHSRLRLKPIADYSFASQEVFIPIIIDEIGHLAREYPIVFLGERSVPVALLGVEQGHNAYVMANGQWDARYRPALLRHYPFAVQAVPETPSPGQAADKTPASRSRLILLIDTSAPFWSETEGTPLFNAQGALSPETERMLQQIQRDTLRQKATRKLAASIAEAGLLVERKIAIRTQEGTERYVGGLRTIDEKALNRMDHTAFMRLRDSGALPLVYASLLSWANFKLGPIGRSHPLPAQAKPQDAFLAGDTLRF